MYGPDAASAMELEAELPSLLSSLLVSLDATGVGFHCADAIPHIDSDDEDEDPRHDDPVIKQDAAEEDLPTPKSITDLPEKLLLAGIYLPGTNDLQGRPIVLFDVQSVVKSSLTAQQVSTLLLYYNSLLSSDCVEGGVMVLAQSGEAEHIALDLLDRALSNVKDRVTVSCVLIWRPADDSDVVSKKAYTFKWEIVRGDSVLRSFVAEDQLPASYGGQCTHDQLEWIEFHKDVERLEAAGEACGRRLVGVLQEAADGRKQQRSVARALRDAQLCRLRRDAASALATLRERAQWLPHSRHVRLSTRRVSSLLQAVERTASRLEALVDGRRDIAKMRALQDETEQVVSWLCQKGEETLRRHEHLATTLPAIKQQEHDFEHFYFVSMRHLDKGSDLLEECQSGGALRELARSLKHHLLGFSERLEDTRERLEDTSRCFCLLDKAYEWALETMKYISRMKADEAQTPDQTLQLLKHLQQYLMAHPPITEDHFSEMLQLAKKLGNDKLLEQAKVAQSRCQETIELIRSQQARLVATREKLGLEVDDNFTLHALLTNRPTSPRNWGPVSSIPMGNCVGRRKSVGSVPFVYKCSHHAAGHSCSCWDSTALPDDSVVRLDDIHEARETAEGLLDDDDDDNDSVCARCSVSSVPVKRNLRRSCTWQYPTENFDEEDHSCAESRLCDHKCDFALESVAGYSKRQDHDETSGKPVPPISVNTHLHCRASSLDLQESQPNVTKTSKTLLLIMREMIQTERDYVKSLEYVIKNYIPELLREDIPQALRGQRNVIFGNIEKIFEFHSQFFLQELECCENSPLLVGQCFLRHEKKFYLYALYNKNKPKSDSLMSEYGSAFFKAKQLELGDKMDLASYLLKPVQRMGKYALLLQQLMKAYPDRECDVADIKSAEQMVRFQLRHGNDLLAMDSLRECDVNVKEQGRLLRQNEFLVWQGKGKKCLRHVFLFEELILFSKARRFPDRKNLDIYIYKNSIKMTDIGLTAKIGDSPTKFEIWFRKRKPNDTFTLQSMSEDIKQAWTEEISKLLWKQAMRNREMRIAEMSSMGIGNKPCLDIRPSKDQISDRSISIAQLSKTAPRFRNSISLSSGEQLRINKRPHSIISVSSSSSSVGSSSSHSSVSAYGTLNLGFDPADSPHLHNRSTTLQSQCSMESGIIADISFGSEDTDSSSSHWQVERSNSSITSISLDSSTSPTSPVDEGKTIIHDRDQAVSQEEVCVKL